MNRWDRWALAAVVATYGLVDTLTSIYSMRQGNFEANAIPRWFFNTFGVVPGHIINKALMLVVVAALIVAYWRLNELVADRLDVPTTLATASRYAIPVVISAVGLALGAWNLSISV